MAHRARPLSSSPGKASGPSTPSRLGPRAPASIEGDDPSAWKAERRGAELVIVSHPSLLEAARRLKDAREEEGWSVAVASVDDLYDEWTHGQKTPWAIRELLRSARERWEIPPRFLLLLGDAAFDPRGYLGLGGFDLVPTKLIDTAFLETASDEWLADLDGDGIGEVAVGRIPARNPEEAARLVEKILAAPLTHRTGNVVLVADRNQGFDFESGSRALRASLAGLSVEEIDHGALGDGARAALGASLASGPLLVNYFGHGSVEVWGGDLLDSDSARSLEGPPAPLYLLMTCFNGFFHDVYTQSLSEALLEAPGGALSVGAFSGLVIPEAQEVLDREALRLLLDGTGRAIGEAFQEARRKVTDPDVRRTFILLGDPTLRIRR